MAESQANTQLEPRQKAEVEREGSRPEPRFRPDVDILESGEEYIVYVDLPGVDEQSVDIRVDRNLLTLDARLSVGPDPSWQPLLTEYRLGGFHREFQLSEDIDASRVGAKLRNGVLELHLPKSDRHRSRTVPVQAG